MLGEKLITAKCKYEVHYILGQFSESYEVEFHYYSGDSEELRYARAVCKIRHKHSGNKIEIKSLEIA